MDTIAQEELVSQIRDVEYAAVATLRQGGNKYYISLHGPDVEFWGMEAGDRILVKIVKVKKPEMGRR